MERKDCDPQGNPNNQLNYHHQHHRQSALPTSSKKKTSLIYRKFVQIMWNEGKKRNQIIINICEMSSIINHKKLSKFWNKIIIKFICYNHYISSSYILQCWMDFQSAENMKDVIEADTNARTMYNDRWYDFSKRNVNANTSFSVPPLHSM